MKMISKKYRYCRSKPGDICFFKQENSIGGKLVATLCHSKHITETPEDCVFAGDLLDNAEVVII